MPDEFVDRADGPGFADWEGGTFQKNTSKSAFQAMLDADMRDVFFNPSEFALSIGYKGLPIIAIVDFGSDPNRQDKSQRTDGRITVKASDVASPKYKDPVLISSVSWCVDRVLSGDGYTWDLAIFRDERAKP
jgi:hypothetical protein